MKILKIIILVIALAMVSGCTAAGVLVGSTAVIGGGTAAPFYIDYRVKKNLDLIARGKQYGQKVVIPLSYEKARQKIRAEMEGAPERPILNKQKEEIARVFTDDYGGGFFVLVTIFKYSSHQTLVKIWKGDVKPFGSGQITSKEDKGFEKDKARYFAKKFGGKVYVEKKISSPAPEQASWGPRRKKYNMTVIVIVQRANLREGPSTQYRVIKILRYGDKLIAIKETGGGWIMVKGKGVKGYIYRKLIVPKK